MEQVQVPTFDQMMNPLIQALKSLGGSGTIEEIDDKICFYHQLMQEYFAALEVKHVGIVNTLAKPLFDEDGRIPGKWDQVVICLSGIVEKPKEMLQEVLAIDPWLAKMCLDRGVHASDEIQDQLVMTFIDELNNWNSDRRRAAIIELGEIRDETAIDALLEALYTEGNDTRMTVAWALGQLGATALPGLYVALYHEDANIRVSAIEALGYISDHDSVPE